MSSGSVFCRRDVLGAGAVMLGAGLTSRAFAASDKGDAPIKVVNSGGGLGGVMQTMVAQLGYAKQFGLDIDYLNVADGSKINAGLIRGDGDMCAWSGFSQVFPAIERGAPLKILGGCLTVPALGIFSSKPEVQSVKDLVGRTFAAGARGSLLYVGAVAALRKHGVDERKVQFVNAGSSQDSFRAMVVGTVDAGIAEVEIMDQQKKYGLHVLAEGQLWNELPNFTWQAAYATDREIAQRRDLLVRMMALDAKLYRFLCGPDSWQAWSEAHKAYYGKQDDPVRARTFWKFIQDRQPLAVNLVLSEERIKYVQEFNVSLGIQNKVLPYDQVADMSLARDALQLLAQG